MGNYAVMENHLLDYVRMSKDFQDLVLVEEWQKLYSQYDFDKEKRTHTDEWVTKPKCYQDLNLDVVLLLCCCCSVAKSYVVLIMAEAVLCWGVRGHGYLGTLIFCSILL